jgi:3-hydroxyacyl-[acyl-carrier-protein] dehydratase
VTPVGDILQELSEVLARRGDVMGWLPFVLETGDRQLSDADRVIGFPENKGVHNCGFIVNKYDRTLIERKKQLTDDDIVDRYGCMVVTGSELHRMKSQLCMFDAGRWSLQYERTNMVSEASVQAQSALRLSPEQVRELLPQREPFLFVNGPADVVPGVRVVAQATYPADNSFYTGHFPRFPLTPGVIIIETMAQAASLMMLTTPRHSGQIVYFVGIREAMFFKAVLPGAVVELTGSIVSMRHGIVESSIEAWTGGVRAAACIL